MSKNRIKEKIVLIGGGGHCKVVIDAIKKSNIFKIYGIIDAKLQKGTSILGIKVLGDDALLPDIRKNIEFAFITIGSIGDCSARKKIYENLKILKFKLPIIKHPKAIVADGVEIDKGTFVAAGAVINPGTKIGKNAIVNTNASVDHDCEIGDFVHIAPGVTLSGGVKVGDETHIGTGANVIQYIIIEENKFIPAGALVYKNEKKLA